MLEIKDSLAIDSKTEITAEDIENKMSIEYGKEDNEEKMIEVFSNLKKSHDAYINTLAVISNFLISYSGSSSLSFLKSSSNFLSSSVLVLILS